MMATKETCPPEELAEYLEAYTSALKPAYFDLVTSTVFASVLLPFLLSLFFFSDAFRRRIVMFFLVVLSVVLAIGQYIFVVVVRLEALYHPSGFWASVNPTLLTLTLILRDLPNFVADLALFARLLAVFPRKTTRSHTLLCVVVPALLIKIGRVGTLAIIVTYDGQNGRGAGLFVYWTAWERKWIILNRAFMVLDNAYPTIFFLWKLRTVFRTDFGKGTILVRDDTLHYRVRMLFWIAMSNFVIPVPLYVGQLIETITDTNSTTFAYFQLHIVFSSMICVAFATIWASSTPAHDPDGYVPEVARPLRRKSSVSIPETLRAERFGDVSSSGVVPIRSKPQDHPLQTWVDFSQTTTK